MKKQMPESECLLNFEYAEFADFENQSLLLDKINFTARRVSLNFSAKFKIVEHYHKNFDPKKHALRIIKALIDII